MKANPILPKKIPQNNTTKNRDSQMAKYAATTEV